MTAPTKTAGEPEKAIRVVAVVRESGLARLADGTAHCVHAYAKIVDEDETPLCRLSDAEALQAQNAELRAEIERMRKNDARYQLLRRGQHWSVINGIGDALRAEVLDAAIDAALTPPTGDTLLPHGGDES